MNDFYHEIVKYTPSGYNKDGIYVYDDWTSISDIGKSIGDNILSVENYLEVEGNYINTILAIMSEIDCHYLTLEYVEANRHEIMKDIKRYKQKYNLPILEFIPILKVGKRVSRKNAAILFRLCLRELCYIEFSCKSKNLKMYFTTEYYLNIQCPICKERLNQIVSENHLYLDPGGL